VIPRATTSDAILDCVASVLRYCQDPESGRHGKTCWASDSNYNTLDGTQVHDCTRPAHWHIGSSSPGIACLNVCDSHARRYVRSGHGTYLEPLSEYFDHGLRAWYVRHSPVSYGFVVFVVVFAVVYWLNRQGLL
jgi:hypothetical protein